VGSWESGGFKGEAPLFGGSCLVKKTAHLLEGQQAELLLPTTMGRSTLTAALLQLVS